MRQQKTKQVMRSDRKSDELSGLEERGLIRKGVDRIGAQTETEEHRQMRSPVYETERAPVSKAERSENSRAGNTGFAEESYGAVKKAMNLLLCRDRSEKELRERLLKEEFDPRAVCDAIDYVRSFGYIDDARFAENYVASFLGKKSRRAMHSELEQKGVDDDLIDQALQTVPEDESDQIMKLLRKKAGEPHKLDDGEKRRVIGFLGRRGFSGGDIWKAIRAFESEVQD
jgi:regulatory protein